MGKLCVENPQVCRLSKSQYSTWIPALGTFRGHVGIPCMKWPCYRRVVGPDDLQRLLPTSAILRFYDRCHEILKM